jgi:acetyltransferase-like isoleucine patch superfamily enzyme
MRPDFKYLLRHPLRWPSILISKLPYFRFIKGTLDYQNAISFEAWFSHKVLNLGSNRNTYWPVDFTSRIMGGENIYAGIDTCPGFSRGCYITGTGGLYIGDYTQIAPHVVIVTANHDVYNNSIPVKKRVSIGKYCWIGAGAIVLPGVELGDFTIVGAGSVVTKSFKEGYCVIAGNPAKFIKALEPSKCIKYEKREKYYGYLNEKQFNKYRLKHLNPDK